MKHLYIIGNGFDLFTGLHTRYVDFRNWLEQNYPFIYENMSAAYEMEGEWWNDFESQLGKLDVRHYVRKFTLPEKPMDEIMAEIKERKAFEKKFNLPPNLYYEGSCANRLKGLLDVLQYCFEKWIDSCHRVITDPKYTRIERENSYFINFNYTDVLQILYEIPEEHVLHIHGRASKHEHLVFGHGSHSCVNGYPTSDEDKTCFELNKYEKNPYVYLVKYQDLSTIISDAEFVHIYSFSFSQVDEDYIDWIEKHTPKTSKWEVSWYSDLDKKRIEKFVLNHWNLKDRLKLMQLEPLNEKDALGLKL